jgi:ethanolamine utilization protein EutN
MLTATVIGSVWATRRLAELPNGAFLEVEAEGTGQRMIAFDVLGSGVGERSSPRGRSRRPGSPASRRPSTR